MKQFLEIGKIVAIQALKGEVRAEPWCDSPEFMCEFDTLYFDGGKTPVEIEHSRVHKNVVVMKIKGVDTPEDAQLLRGKILFMDRNDVELDEGCYFVQDLIGLEVVGEDGKVYGKLTQVSPTGANDVYHIKNGEKEYLIPAIPDVVLETDIENGKMVIFPMEGLFED